MLVATDGQQRAIEAEQADRAGVYHCPECSAPVCLRRGRLVIAHFAHVVRPLSCTLAGETATHLWMKHNMRLFFGIANTRVEQALIPGHRADVVVVAQRLVIECQVSPIALGEWEQRTHDYNRQGYAVLWVWWPTRLGISPDKQDLNDYDAIALGQRGVRVKPEVLACHKLAYGRVYVLARTGQLVAVHMEPVRRVGIGGAEHRLKRTRYLQLWPLTPTPLLARTTFHQETKTRLAQIEPEVAWWH